MSFIDRFKALRKALKAELRFYQLLLTDSRIPKAAKWLIGLAVGYAISPVDLIPDFIPIFGYLDDMIIVPALIFLALKMIPQDVIDDCRSRVKTLS